MKKIISIILTLAMVTVMLAACGGSAPATTAAPADTTAAPADTTAAPAETDAPAETEAPKGSGKLVIYSSLTEANIEALVPLFEEETGIELEVLAMGTGDALKRIETEAENPLADVMWSGSITGVKSHSEYFEDYVSPNEEFFFDSCKNVEGNLTRIDVAGSVLMVNTDLIGDIEIKGYADLLNPELKGKIAMCDPGASGSAYEHVVNMLYAMGNGDPEAGWDYVDKFCENLDGKLLSGSSAVYKGVADGEYVVGLTYEQACVQYIAAGAPVDIVYMEEGVIMGGNGVFIIKGCKNLENAKIFVDWVTSKEIQQLSNDTQFRRTVRKDVTSDICKPLDEINQIYSDVDYELEHKADRIAQFEDIFTNH